MGWWGTEPWDNDNAADWFINMMDTTGLAKYVENTLHREIDDDDPGAAADKIRAAVSVVILLGHPYVWPVDDWEQDLKSAISRLEEILAKNYGGGSEEQIQAEIAVLRSRLERKTDAHVEKVKWWHFDE